MVRLHYVFILPALALAACVTPSKSLGAGESTGTEESTDPSVGDSESSGDTDSASGNTLTTSAGTDTDDPPTGDEWCDGFTDEETCNAAPEMEVPGGMPQFCQWIDMQTLTIDAANNSCGTDGPVSRCLTFDFNPNEGCGPIPCTLGPLLMTTAIARPIDEDTFEVWGLTDIFCGGGTPVGDWIPADDPSLAQCQMTCGFDNPCGIPLDQYLMTRSDASKDAPVDSCGVLTLDAPVSDWQDAHDCVIEHSNAGQGFWLVADLQGIDSFPQVGFMGLQGESYAVSRFDKDTGGIDPGTLIEEPAEGIGPIDDCVVSQGELCLAVSNAGDVVQICPN